jgi:hypothetical protein
MKAQAVATNAVSLGLFLTSILCSQEENGHEDVPRLNGESATLSGPFAHSTKQTAEAPFDQPVTQMVNLRWMFSQVPVTRRRYALWRGLTLLTMLWGCSPRRDRPSMAGPILPHGCVMVVRYASR